MSPAAIFLNALAAVIGLTLGIIAAGVAAYLWMRRRGM